MDSDDRAVRIPELLMPAGGFDSAIAAIDGGADALYFGFADFSARKQARNFDRLEYRRLLRLARDKGVRLYAALNTIILQRELAEAAELLSFLGRFPPDAIIVQDWGLARLIRHRYSGIAIHASTQTAVQGPDAIAVARGMGASRIVLPRETSIEELARMSSAAPGVELEVFVHGALCYSVSGLCLASGMLLGRSGNRGECAQLCRSYYDAEEGPIQSRDGRGNRGRGYWFSCRDLYLGDLLAELVRAGASSLKVEGRMKSPEYCYNVARLYRGHLEHLAGTGPSDDQMRSMLDAARVCFSRDPTRAWAFARGGESLIDAEYPGHRGILAGSVAASGGGRLTIKTVAPLALRDGLFGFERGDTARPVSFSALGMRDAETGRPIHRAAAGSLVELDAPAVFPLGSDIRKLSSRDLDRRVPSPEEFEPERSSIPLRLRLEDGALAAEIDMPNFDGCGGRTVNARIGPGNALPIEKGRVPGGFAKALAVFGESGVHDFRLEASIATEPVETKTGASADSGKERYALADAFIPPSVLKREKNRIYAAAAEALSSAERSYAFESLVAAAASREKPNRPSSQRPILAAPPRSALCFPHEALPSGFPFATSRILDEEMELPRLDGVSYLPLAPLSADREIYAEQALCRAERELRENSLCVGISALHHIALARRLSEIQSGAWRDGRLSFFIDINLYVANALALIALDEAIGGVAFAYFYVEGAEEDYLRAAAALGEKVNEGLPPLVPCGHGFEPPLFQSFACLLKHIVNPGFCPPSCARSWTASFRDRDRRYRAIVEDCVSWVFRVY